MIIAIDTSTRLAGIALFDGAQILVELVWTSQDYHTVELAPMIERALQITGTHTSDLQAVGVATGPGSFTGLRIGLALAKGLAFGNRLPLVGVPTLDFLAYAQPVTDMPLAAVLRAGRGRLAVGWYHSKIGHWQSTGKLVVMDAQELSGMIHKPTLVCGELTEEERRFLARKRKNVLLVSPAQSLRRPSFLAELAWERWRSGQVDDPMALAPIYLHVGETIPG
jgi:tRNA threonylcarbamoyladenosine biosynthesis protein TsaB